MKHRAGPKNLVAYQAKSGAIELRADVAHETIWATQTQIVRLFGVDQSVVSRHIRNAFRDGEIDEKSNMQKMHIAKSDRPVALYSLDVILSVGYRVNSKATVTFRPPTLLHGEGPSVYGWQQTLRSVGIRLVSTESENRGCEEDQPDWTRRSHASHHRKRSGQEGPDDGVDHPSSAVKSNNQR